MSQPLKVPETREDWKRAAMREQKMRLALLAELDRYREALKDIAGASFLGVPSTERMDIIYETATEALSPNPSETGGRE